MSDNVRNRRRRGCLRIFAGMAVAIMFFVVIGLIVWTLNTNRQIDASERYAFTDGAPGAFLEVDGYRLHYQRFGDPTAKPLLFIHGFNVNGGYEWSEIAPYLQDDYFLIAPDLPPFGHSERILEHSPLYTTQGQAQALMQLMDALGLDQVTVVAASAGGGVAAEMALLAPTRIDRLVMIGTEVYDQGGGIFAQLGALPLGIGRANTWTALGGGSRSTAFFAIGCRTNGYCPSDAVVARRQRLAEIQATTDALIARNATPNLSRIPADLSLVTTPTLVLWGGNDLRGVETGKQLVTELAHATLQIVEGSDHTPHLHQPAQTARLIDQFLRTAQRSD